MKIKIKLKTLILITILTLTFILFIVPVLNLEIANALKEKGSDKAEIFYRSYMKSPLKINKDKGLYSYGDELTKGLKKYQISSSGWGGAEMTSQENIEKAMGLFEEVLLNDKKDKYNGKYSSRAYTKLLDTSISMLDIKKIDYWIDWGSKIENQEIQYISKLYKAYYKFVEKDYKETERILKELDKDLLDEKYYQLLAETNLHLNKQEKARENYKKLAEIAATDGIDRSKTYFGGGYLLLDEYAIKERLDKLNGEYKVKGKITHEGKGLPFVEVYLDKDIGVFSTLGRAADAVTDKNGEFETLPLKQDVYDISIIIHSSQLYDKVFLSGDRESIQLKEDTRADFQFATPINITSPKENVVLKEGETLNVSWEEVKGADYYTIKTLIFSEPKERAGAVSGIIIKDKNDQEKLKTNSIEIGIDNIDKKPAIYYYDGDEEIVNPGAILGSFIPNIENPLIVDAYDKDDKLVSSSVTLISNYNNMVDVRFDKDLTKGEKLILDKKYEDAIAHYENILKKDPKDKESLLYLTRFYSIAWKKDKSNLTKALKYAQIYEENYDDYNLSLEVIDQMNNKQKRENKEYIKLVLENTNPKDRDSNYHYIEARYFIGVGDFIKAKESYEKIKEYKHIDILYIEMYLENFDKAATMLENAEFGMRKMNEMKSAEALKKVKTLNQGDKDIFKNFLKSIIKREKNQEELSRLYYDTLELAANHDLKVLLKEIAKEEYLEEEYIIRD